MHRCTQSQMWAHISRRLLVNFQFLPHQNKRNSSSFFFLLFRQLTLIDGSQTIHCSSFPLPFEVNHKAEIACRKFNEPRKTDKTINFLYITLVSSSRAVICISILSDAFFFLIFFFYCLSLSLREKTQNRLGFFHPSTRTEVWNVFWWSSAGFRTIFVLSWIFVMCDIDFMI